MWIHSPILKWLLGYNNSTNVPILECRKRVLTVYDVEDAGRVRKKGTGHFPPYHGGGTMGTSGTNLADQQCVPCRGGVPPLKGEDLRKYAAQLSDWKVVDEHHIVKTFLFPDFQKALEFVNRAGAIAEEQGHHP